MTIQEAIKANETKRVRCVVYDSEWYPVGQLIRIQCSFKTEAILAEWEAEEVPLEIWCNVYEDNDIWSFSTKERALLGRGKSCLRTVKFREVLE